MATDQHTAHPTPRLYVRVAILLAVLTAIEVGFFYLEEAGAPTGLVIPALIILALLKFIIVIGYYMHLRYDPRTLSRFFAAGFALAIVLYTIVLASFGLLALRSI